MVLLKKEKALVTSSVPLRDCKTSRNLRQPSFLVLLWMYWMLTVGWELRCCYPSPTSVRSVAGLIESNKKLNEKILEINEFYSLHQERIYFCHFLPPQPFLFSTRSNVFCICQMDRNKVQQKCVFVGAIAKYCFGLMWKSFKANIKIFFSISCKIDESIKQWIITNWQFPKINDSPY